MMPALEVAPIAVAACLVGLPVLYLTARRIWRWLKWSWRQPMMPAFDLWNEGPEEPGWTQQVGRWGPYRFGSAFSVNDHLLKVDAMARRGELNQCGD